MNAVKRLDTKAGSAKAALPPVARRPEDLLSSRPSAVVVRPAVLPWEAQPIADVRRAQCWPSPAVSAAGGAVCPEHPLSGTVPSFLVAGTQSNSQQGSLARAQGCVRGSMAVCVCVYLLAAQAVCVCVCGCIFRVGSLQLCG